MLRVDGIDQTGKGRVRIVGTTGVILSAAYALWLYRRVVFGRLEKSTLKDILDLNFKEVVCLVPLVALVVA